MPESCARAVCGTTQGKPLARAPSPVPGQRLARCRGMPSTVIRRFLFRPAEAALDIEFVTGRVYRYHAVPEAVARGLAAAGSKGAYFNRSIRDSFACERLRGWQAPDDEPLSA